MRSIRIMAGCATLHLTVVALVPTGNGRIGAFHALRAQAEPEHQKHGKKKDGPADHQILIQNAFIMANCITANCSTQAAGARDTTLIPHSGAVVSLIADNRLLAAELKRRFAGPGNNGE